MAVYEVVREVQNLCANNQMRDVFFDEIETDDPVEWIRREVKGKEVNLTVDRKADGSMTIYVESAGVSQKFLFTPGRTPRQIEKHKFFRFFNKFGLVFAAALCYDISVSYAEMGLVCPLGSRQ